MDAVVQQGLAYIAILDVSATEFKMVDDKVDLTYHMEQFVDDFNSRLIFEMQDLDETVFKQGIDVNQWIPEYFKVDTSYFDGTVLAEVSFEEN